MPEPIMVLGAPNSELRKLGADALRVVGAGPEDQVCTLSITGTFNVSAMLRAIGAKAVPFETFRMPIDKNLAHHVSLRDIDHAYAMALPLERVFEPVLFIFCPPQPPATDIVAELIDGANRLHRLTMMGLPHFTGIGVLLADAEQFRVVHEIRKAGEWVRLADAELLKITWGRYTKPGWGLKKR
jgi:hypothetical protein